MSYGKDLRKRVLDFVASGGSKAEAARQYKIHVCTIFEWLKQPVDYTPVKRRNCTARKYDRNELALYVEQHPDALLKEIANHFNVSICSIANSLKRMNMTRKKSHSGTKKASKITSDEEII